MTTSIPQTMRAWVYKASGKPSDVLKLVDDHPLPSLPGYPIIVKVHAASLNPVGYKTISEIPSLITKKPAVPESDFAGVVVGGDLSGTGLTVGDEVFGQIPADKQIKNGVGVLAEYTVANPSICVRKPKNISFAEGSSVTLAGLTAHTSLIKTGQAKTGDRVLVNGGTGGVGMWAVQIAKAQGCYVVATCSESSIEIVKGLGADEAIDYKKGDLYQRLSEMYGATDKRFDVVFDTIGVPALYSHCDGYIKPTGRFASISADTSSISSIAKAAGSILDFKLRPRFLGGKEVSYNMVGLNAEQEGPALRQLAQWLEEGKIKAILDSEYSFDKVHEAYAKIMSGRAKGKVVVNVV